MELIAALLVFGVLLLVLEIFLPGMIAGIIGGCCLIAAIFFSYTDYGMRTGNAVLAGVTVGLIIGTLLWLKYFPESKAARPFVSKRIIGGTLDLTAFLNKTGTAYTTLRPAGTAVIEGHRVDVVTEGSMVPKGASIKVVQVEGTRIVVRST
jgi:membrane-bound serine protease (ClpP class)